MLVSRERMLGTIGGGQLEYIAIDAARALMARGGIRQVLDVPLGPEIGQCCGGRTRLAVVRAEGATHERLLALAAKRAGGAAGGLRDRRRPCRPGAGGGAEAAAGARRCSSTGGRRSSRWRRPGSRRVLTPLPEEIVRRAAPGAAFVVLTHDHALDFLIAREALARGDAAYVGMIGSRTKRVSFLRWLREAGAVDTGPLVCPIGAAGRPDKRPEVIAAFVAAEIMQTLAAWQAGPVRADLAHAG